VTYSTESEGVERNKIGSRKMRDLLNLLFRHMSFGQWRMAASVCPETRSRLSWRRRLLSLVITL